MKRIDGLLAACAACAVVCCTLGAVHCRELLGTTCSLPRTLNCPSQTQSTCASTECELIKCSKEDAGSDTVWLGAPVPPGAWGIDANTVLDVLDPEDDCGSAKQFVPFEGERFRCFWDENASKCKCPSAHSNGSWANAPHAGGCDAPRRYGGTACQG